MIQKNLPKFLRCRAGPRERKDKWERINYLKNKKLLIRSLRRSVRTACDLLLLNKKIKKKKLKAKIKIDLFQPLTPRPQSKGTPLPDGFLGLWEPNLFAEAHKNPFGRAGKASPAQSQDLTQLPTAKPILKHQQEIFPIFCSPKPPQPGDAPHSCTRKSSGCCWKIWENLAGTFVLKV